jgi:hypothetical protein
LGLHCQSSKRTGIRTELIQETAMRKTILAIAASALLAVATLTPSTADARCRGCGIGLGLLGGLIVGGAIANAYAYPRSYYPVDGYAPYPAYAGPGPIDCPGGYWARRPIYNPAGFVVGYSRPRFFCPAY